MDKALTTRRIATLLVVATLLTGTAFLTTAAGDTAITADAESNTISAGETTTVTVAVTDADGGIGAGEIAVAVDGSVAEITDITINGDPGAVETSRNDDNSEVGVEYAFADTDDTGTVTVLTATVEGEAAGTTQVSVVPVGSNDEVLLFDEEGTGYTIGNIGSATLTVTGDGETPTTEEPTTEEPTTEEPTTEEPTTEEPTTEEPTTEEPTTEEPTTEEPTTEEPTTEEPTTEEPTTEEPTTEEPTTEEPTTEEPTTDAPDDDDAKDCPTHDDDHDHAADGHNHPVVKFPSEQKAVVKNVGPSKHHGYIEATYCYDGQKHSEKVSVGELDPGETVHVNGVTFERTDSAVHISVEDSKTIHGVEGKVNVHGGEFAAESGYCEGNGHADDGHDHDHADDGHDHDHADDGHDHAADGHNHPVVKFPSEQKAVVKNVGASKHHGYIEATYCYDGQKHSEKVSVGALDPGETAHANGITFERTDSAVHVSVEDSKTLHGVEGKVNVHGGEFAAESGYCEGDHHDHE